MPVLPCLTWRLQFAPGSFCLSHAQETWSDPPRSSAQEIYSKVISSLNAAHPQRSIKDLISAPPLLRPVSGHYLLAVLELDLIGPKTWDHRVHVGFNFSSVHPLDMQMPTWLRAKEAPSCKHTQPEAFRVSLGTAMQHCTLLEPSPNQSPRGEMWSPLLRH